MFFFIFTKKKKSLNYFLINFFVGLLMQPTKHMSHNFLLASNILNDSIKYLISCHYEWIFIIYGCCLLFVSRNLYFFVFIKRINIFLYFIIDMYQSTIFLVCLFSSERLWFHVFYSLFYRRVGKHNHDFDQIIIHVFKSINLFVSS